MNQVIEGDNVIFKIMVNRTKQIIGVVDDYRCY